MSYIVVLYVDRGEEELELRVIGSVSNYIPAVVHLRPEYCHPAEGGEVTIEKITLHGQEWGGQLTEEEQERAEKGLFEEAQLDQGYQNEYFDDDLDIEEIRQHW